MRCLHPNPSTAAPPRNAAHLGVAEGQLLLLLQSILDLQVKRNRTLGDQKWPVARSSLRIYKVLLKTFLAMLDLHCYTQAFPSRSKWASHCIGSSYCRAWAQVHGWEVVLTGLVAPRHVESSRTRDQTRVPCIGRWILNHWTTREVPQSAFLSTYCHVTNEESEGWRGKVTFLSE